MDEFPRKTFKTSDDAQLSYISPGKGKSIVLIHGWSQSAEQFKYQISAFAERYHVVAIDLRGHGESEKVTYGYRISRLSKDIQELISFLQLEKPHLLGHVRRFPSLSNISTRTNAQGTLRCLRDRLTAKAVGDALIKRERDCDQPHSV